MKNFEDMTNKELAEYCKENNIDVPAKNVSKPSKTEFLNAIYANEEDINSEGIYTEEDALSNADDFLNVDENNSDENVTESAKQKKESRSQKRQKQWKELMALKRVIINSNDNNQTRIKNQVEYCTWGNRLLGHHTDRFIIGKPWHVREGALRNLKNMMISRSVQDEEGNTVRFETVPAYIIQELPALTKEEIDVIAKRQIIRDSSIESLI